ncbi:MAG: enoyl-CoA hydratase/isomerase family protein [Acidobacteria bacterium]|nr:enoyl-CoA hydratase/isomerase family protein [Acidobacteriota bacterium]
MEYSMIIVDEPAEGVRRITLNNPAKRNPLGATMRREIIAALRAHEDDAMVKVTIIRGAGPCFSAGYDLTGGAVDDEPPAYRSAGGLGSYPREVTETWMSIWDLAKPVIAQIHSYCLAGATELATGCDLVYVADDARIGYPAVRFGTPDMQWHAWLLGPRLGMELMLTGDSISGEEAARAGFATRSYPAEELEQRVLEIAQRIALIPSDILQINKRTVHRGMAVMGMPTAIRQGTELCALAIETETFAAFMAEKDKEGGLTAALTKRDAKFGDYRTSH